MSVSLCDAFDFNWTLLSVFNTVTVINIHVFVMVVELCPVQYSKFTACVRVCVRVRARACVCMCMRTRGEGVFMEREVLLLSANQSIGGSNQSISFLFQQCVKL